jgi:type IV secretory pathway TrbD component
MLCCRTLVIRRGLSCLLLIIALVLWIGPEAFWVRLWTLLLMAGLATVSRTWNLIDDVLKRRAATRFLWVVAVQDPDCARGGAFLLLTGLLLSHSAV